MRWTPIAIAATVGAVFFDLVTCLLYRPGVNAIKPLLVERAQGPVLGMLFVGFAALCAAVIGVRKIAAARPARFRVVLAYSAWGFAFLLMYFLLDAVGALGAEAGEEAPGWAMALMFTFLLYPAFYYWDFEETIERDTPRFLATQLGAVLVVDAMLILMGAFWEYTFFTEAGAGGGPIETRSFSAMLYMYPIFLLFFASPRFLMLSKEGNHISLASALLSVAFYVWSSLPLA